MIPRLVDPKFLLKNNTTTSPAVYEKPDFAIDYSVGENIKDNKNTLA